MRRRILEPIGLLIFVGVIGSMWISLAAISAHDQLKRDEAQMIALLNRVGATAESMTAAKELVAEVMRYDVLLPAETVAERLDAGGSALRANVKALYEVSFDAEMTSAVAELENAASAWLDEASIAIGVVASTSIPTKRSLNQQSRVVRAAMDQVDDVAQLKAQQRRDAESERFAWRLGGALAVMAALFSVAVAVSLRRASQLIVSLRELAAAQSRIRGGDFDARVAGRERSDEIGEMARGVAAFAHGLRELTEAKERIEHMALHDPLTGLANRRALNEHLSEAMSRGADGGRLALLHVDLDRFKQVNDTFGHGAGDALLRDVAESMAAQVRGCDMVARIGGDEFVVVIENCASQRLAEEIAVRLIAAASLPREFEGATLRVGASVGIAFAADADGDVERLLTNADLALYEAKAAGRGRAGFYAEATRREIERRNLLIEQLRRGVEAGELVPYFQPQVDAADNRVLGFEALIRWRHPERGVLGPGAFLEEAFDIGLGDALTEITIARSLDALRRWREAGLTAPRVSVNLSAKQLRDAELVARVRAMVERADAAPRDLAIEVVESVLFSDEDDVALRHISELKRLGFPIELDDFGTGHASISNLQRLRVDRIKIDRSFISGLDEDPEKETIARALIDLSLNLGIGCIAEGVESESERSKLLSMGCGMLQGYGVARPMPEEDVSTWLRDRASASPTTALVG